MKFQYLFIWFLGALPFVSGFQMQPKKQFRKMRLLNAITLKRNAETFSKTTKKEKQQPGKPKFICSGGVWGGWGSAGGATS